MSSTLIEREEIERLARRTLEIAFGYGAAGGHIVVPSKSIMEAEMAMFVCMMAAMAESVVDDEAVNGK